MSDLVRRPAATTRASDADRDRVLSILSTATADGRLTVDEHHELMTQTLSAKTIGELAAITHDLGLEAPPVPAAAPAPVAAPGRRWRGLTAIFGARTRKGSWAVPTEFKATAVFGAVEIDLRDAVFDGPEALCVANTVFGAIEITVPDWVRVVDEGVVILGAREEAGSSVGPQTHTLRLRGLCVFGAVEIKRKAPKAKSVDRAAAPDPPIGAADGPAALADGDVGPDAS